MSLGAAGTPSSFINGRNLRGAQPYEAFVVVVEEELAKARALVARGTPRARVYAQTIRDGATTQQMLPTTASGDEAAAANPRIELPVPAAPLPVDRRAPPWSSRGGRLPVPSARACSPPSQLLQDYDGRVRLVWRDMPLPFHPNAHIAAPGGARGLPPGREHCVLGLHQPALCEPARPLARHTRAPGPGGDQGQLAQFRQALDTPSATAPPWTPTPPRCRPPASRARRAS
ncbi:MAG: hypothetical protein IPG17_27470 [Sandaracinaceae bacterium]|nr:hypothetical protein [Sandaracinaceae bacterium]